MPVLPTQAVRLSGLLGEPLPDPWPSLKARKARFRRGQLGMVAGAPNAGKTAFAQVLAARIGVPTLYVNADTELRTMTTRMACILTGHTQDEVDATRKAGQFESTYLPLIAASHISYSDMSGPTMEQIAVDMDAYCEMRGEYPWLVVVDNLMNIEGSSDNEWQAMRQTVSELHYLARESHACVLLLHHTSEASADTTKPPPRKEIQGKVSQLPELILTLGSDGQRLGVAVVKNRNGPADPKAENPLWFGVDIGRMKFTEQQGFYNQFGG